ncbi:EscU/YscU/HrcU family type III secretion system export apparatus switch protein [Falsirhodobacter halotolerans]|uniref:EscU/YscU/HrcU family type III secretion system export apparatus switch protein n=1 Tax=Falsirhodobacter halotolerans TaxID=1146892 RepID=UPI001FD24CC3|nr:EscU/YscU/HrcU family type III secretion system export apparatus switch protein [Falsirhodobacter halotolerans]MCJ8140832.1 EscU/YscU/HrcU family type III secretion system export apparatus switch protein [Falsirhodobacter halotolerans]
MSGTSEEKSLPASDKKLRDARGKGQVAKSQDLVTGMTLLAAVIYLGVVLADRQAQVRSLVDLVADRAAREPLADVWPELRAAAAQMLMGTAVPLLLLTLAVVIITNLTVMRGFVFSTEPVMPKFEKISPVAGARRVFSLRSVVEFLKAVVKIAAMGTAFVIVFRSGIGALLLSPSCGADCIRASFDGMVRPLMLTAIASFLIVGMIDVMVQQWLFRRDMQMTKSEMKRERKDAEGDPAILQQRRQQRREMQASASKVGIAQASVVIGTAGDWAVAVRYVRGETSVPVVVARATPAQSAALMAEAQARAVPVVGDTALAALLARTARTGDPVPTAQFQRVADILVGARLI